MESCGLRFVSEQKKIDSEFYRFGGKRGGWVVGGVRVDIREEKGKWGGDASSCFVCMGVKTKNRKAYRRVGCKSQLCVGCGSGMRTCYCISISTLFFSFFILLKTELLLFYFMLEHTAKFHKKGHVFFYCIFFASMYYLRNKYILNTIYLRSFKTYGSLIWNFIHKLGLKTSMST